VSTQVRETCVQVAVVTMPQTHSPPGALLPAPVSPTCRKQLLPAEPGTNVFLVALTASFQVYIEPGLSFLTTLRECCTFHPCILWAPGPWNYIGYECPWGLSGHREAWSGPVAPAAGDTADSLITKENAQWRDESAAQK
jgi:hypothetical protein